MKNNENEKLKLEEEFSKFIAIADSVEGEILSIKERLEHFYNFMEIVYKLEMNSLYSYYIGISDEQSTLLTKSKEVENFLYFSYIASNYGFYYSQSLHKAFHELRLSITDYFIKHYQDNDRKEIYNNLIELNREEKYLKVLNENTNVKIYPDIVFAGFLNALLSQLYILTENYSDAFGSLMNASFFYGILEERYSPIPNEKIDEFVNASLSAQNKEKAKSRWSKHNQTRPEKKKQYLQIMDEQNFTTFAETATYIKQHIETGKKPSYRTIELWLSQASRGDFS